jgi:(1->4)-alpha-D-glucan 1-alpha-D-glucosylmutase
MVATVPIATYRLQLTRQFGFHDAAALVPYLKDIGVSHLYASPFLAARPGSTHGYDIVDHNRLNDELGGEAGFAALSAALRDADIGLILDFVPNHMGIGYSDNAWWLDVLEWGQKSPHAASFDIDWDGLPYRHKPGVLLPILGRPYGDALRSGDIALKFDAAAGSFAAWYFEHKLPINPQRYAEIVRTVVTAAGAEATEEGRKLLAIVEPYRTSPTPSYREAPALKATLAEADCAALIDRGLAAYDARTETGWPLLHRLLERQAYHLAYWRVAFSAINYRRFFDINDLAGLRPEHAATFAAMHHLVARLIADGALQGLRLDHIDGLRDPVQYVRRLRDLIRRVRPRTRRDGFYLVVEKILGPEESIPPFSGIDGTTGYERLNLISRALLDDRGLAPLDSVWRDFSGEGTAFVDTVREAKARVLDTMLASEFTVLARALGRIAAGHFSTRDYTVGRLQAALRAYVIEFPVYRTYVTGRINDADRALIDDVIARIRAAWGGPDPEIFEFLDGCVTGDLARNRGYSAPRVRNFAMKLQQFTGPLMAKSLEDTAFYRYHRLIALNEVGGEPASPGLSVEQFHQEQARLLREQRHGLVATATHDTKRGEDARMRILALAEIPEDWRAAVLAWKALNERFTYNVNGGRWPSAAHEYMLYQTLIGSWPAGGPDDGFVERVAAYAWKAAREGKQQTSWTNPNEAYEQALQQFVEAILDPARSAEFIGSLSQFAQRAALLGALNSLSQIALKLTLPGVPDFYQGTELWDLSMVDPDNRRPVDFAHRRKLLAGEADWPELARNWPDGRVKFALIRTLLALRQRHAALFRGGGYTGLPLAAAHESSAIAFARDHRRERLVVVVGRHFAQATQGGRQWPEGFQVALGEPLDGYRDVLRDRAVSSSTVHLDDLPVGIFLRS